MYFCSGAPVLCIHLGFVCWWYKIYRYIYIYIFKRLQSHYPLFRKKKKKELGFKEIRSRKQFCHLQHNNCFCRMPIVCREKIPTAYIYIHVDHAIALINGVAFSSLCCSLYLIDLNFGTVFFFMIFFFLKKRSL